MQSTIIQSHQGQLKVGTWDLAQRIGVQHRLLKHLLERHKGYLGEQFPKKKRPTKRKGGQIEEYLLSEDQTRLLLALLMNHPKMRMGLHLCIIRTFDSEVEFFKALEELLGETEELEEMKKW